MRKNEQWGFVSFLMRLTVYQEKNGTKTVPFGYYSGKRYPFRKVAPFLYKNRVENSTLFAMWYQK